MFTVFCLLALQGLSTPMDPLDELRKSMFGGIHRIDIFHTGHAFDSATPRPVFMVSANVFCHLAEERVVYLPPGSQSCLAVSPLPGCRLLLASGNQRVQP